MHLTSIANQVDVRTVRIIAERPSAATDQRIVTASAVAIHDTGVAGEDALNERIPSGQMVVAAAGGVVHLVGVAIKGR